jgi:hypothetical protein
MTSQIEEMTGRVKHWIDNGRDPGVAHWHAALEATMASFLPHLQAGRLIPVHSLEKSEYAFFREVYASLDLSPVIEAAFIPGAMGGVLTLPAAVDSLRRIHKDNKSVMLLCRRSGEKPRILSAEISKEAWKPGVDLFEEGGLLGNYEFDSSADCIRELSKLMRAHLWSREKWTAADHADYTLNWFTRVVDTNRTDAPVKVDCSYIHNPVLLNLKPVDAVFKLIFDMAARQFQESEELSLQAGKTGSGGTGAEEDRHRFLEGRILGLLNLLRDSQAVDFTVFTPRENEHFRDSFARTVTELDGLLEKGPGTVL